MSPTVTQSKIPLMVNKLRTINNPVNKITFKGLHARLSGTTAQMFDDQSLLESVIQLTAERDKKSLFNALAEVMAELIDFEALLLLRIPPMANGHYLDISVSIPANAYRDKLILISNEHGKQRLVPDDSITACIDNAAITSASTEAGNRLLFPIIVNNKAIGILDIYGHQHSPESEKLIQNFIRIYSNFLAIIDDNEHDTLTGLLNRRTFDAQLSELLSEIAKRPLPVTDSERRLDKKATHHWIGILDIDHFKLINDNYGHVYGDEVLLLFADLMKKSFRSHDLLFRYGGEEFVVVLSPATESDALMVFNRFRQKLESHDFPQIGKVTVSIGMVKVNKIEHTTTLLEHADKALYYAKEHGRNQVQNYHELIEAGLLQKRDIEDDIEFF